MDKFKEAFDKALDRGEDFSAAANNCIGSYMDQFDEGCAGIQKFAYTISLDTNRLKTKLKAQTCNHGKKRVPGRYGYSRSRLSTIINY